MVKKYECCKQLTKQARTGKLLAHLTAFSETKSNGFASQGITRWHKGERFDSPNQKSRRFSKFEFH
jgi:hypothetical protein